jgi:hypothetical protein
MLKRVSSHFTSLTAIFVLLGTANLLVAIGAPPRSNSRPSPSENAPDTQPDERGPAAEADLRETTQAASPADRLVGPDSARDWLQLADMSDSEIDSFQDGQPIPDHQATLLKILYRMRQISPLDVARWEQPELVPDACVQQPSQQRIRFFRLAGRATNWTEVALSDRLAELFGFDRYFQVVVESANSRFRWRVCTRKIPEAWRNSNTLHEPVVASAMFLKVGPTIANRTELIFATARIGWYPDTQNSALGIGPNEILLASLGMDVGRFDALANRDRRPIGGSERETFYQLLNAADRASAVGKAFAAQPLELEDLLQHPENFHGHVIQFRGSLRRINRVLIDDPEIQQRFQISHYYQLDILVPLGKQTIELRSSGDDSTGAVFTNYFPFTCCMRDVPEPWSGSGSHQSLNQPVMVAGFFYKVWSYPSGFVSQFDPHQLQLSPMVMAVQVQPIRPPAKDESRAGLWLGIGFVAIIAAIWLVALWSGRGDRNSARRARRVRFEATSTIDVRSNDG